jgi:translation initiation factor IF-1
MKQHKNKRSKQEIEMMGTVINGLKGIGVRVRLENGPKILAYLSGRTRRHRIGILLSDRVKVELSPCDLDRGRIVYRYKRQQLAGRA